MAITKVEAKRKFDDAHTSDLVDAERRLDEVLARQLPPVSVAMNFLPLAIRERLLQRYRQAGWTVSYQEGYGQREPSYYTFS